jgi:hypothetical protein
MFSVQIGCGGVARQNCTFFTSSTSVAAGSCGIKVCKCSSDICQVIMKDVIVDDIDVNDVIVKNVIVKVV